MEVRTFVSIPVPNAAGLEPLLRDLRTVRGVRTTAPAQLHITLRFIGDLDEERTDEVTEIVSQAVKGLKPARVTLKGTGAFPSVSRPRTIWVGVETDLPLQRMSESISRGLDRAGIGYDPKPFKAHITVARVQGTPNAAPMLRKYADTEFATFVCTSVKVMRSELTPSGAKHYVLGDCDLRQWTPRPSASHIHEFPINEKNFPIMTVVLF